MGPLQPSAAAGSINVMTLSIWRLDAGWFEFMPASKYLPGITIQTKLRVEIKCPIIETLGKVQMTKRTTQDHKLQTKLRYLLPVKMQHKRQQFLHIFELFETTNKRAINFMTDTMHHRHATTTTVSPTFDPRPSFSIAPHDLTNTDGQHTISCTHIRKMRLIQIRLVFLHVAWQGDIALRRKIRDFKTKLVLI